MSIHLAAEAAMGAGLPELATIEEAAAWLRTPVSTLYNWRSRGRGPKAVKIGRNLAYPRTNLVQFVRELEESA